MAATPPGTAPNYIVGESRSGDIIAIVTAMTALSTFVLAVRLWSRIGLQGVSPGADDWTIIAAWVFSVAFTVDVSTRKSYRAQQIDEIIGPPWLTSCSAQKRHMD